MVRRRCNSNEKQKKGKVRMAKEKQIYEEKETLHHWLVAEVDENKVSLIQDIYELDVGEEPQEKSISIEELKSDYKLIGKAGVNREYYDV